MSFVIFLISESYLTLKILTPASRVYFVYYLPDYTPEISTSLQ